MKTLTKATRLSSHRLKSLFSSFAKDKKGIGAVEFAIVTPILIMAYIGAFEISLGFTVSGKVARAASTVADLVAQQSTVDKTYLGNMKNVAQTMLAPYKGFNFTLKISGIKVDNTNKGTVIWSRDQNGATPYAVNSTVNLPAQFATKGAFVIRTELIVPHELLLFAPNLASKSITKINLAKTAYFRSRQAETISCTNC